MSEIPQAVLADRLSDLINGRRVHAAVFTTFSFDPEFFELHILPTLFGPRFNQYESTPTLHTRQGLPSLATGWKANHPVRLGESH